MEKTFQVNKLGCQNCANTVSKTLNGLDGVSEAKVDITSKSANVVFDQATVSEEQMAAAVADAGYELVI